jgi:hypothetical protein
MSPLLALRFSLRSPQACLNRVVWAYFVQAATGIIVGGAIPIYDQLMPNVALFEIAMSEPSNAER